MRIRLFLGAALLITGAVVAQNSFLQSAQGNDTTTMNTTCTAQTQTGAQEGCTPSFLAADHGSVLGHEILAGGCARGNLHVMRFSPRTASVKPLVAAWCG